jgi:hypothetical protein
VKIEESSESEGKENSSGGQTSPNNLPQGASRDSSSDQSAARWFASKNENVLASDDRKNPRESTYSH